MNRFITFGIDHLDYLVAEYVEFYDEARPHQQKDNHPLTGDWLDDDEPIRHEETIACRTRLGGVLKHYERRAA